MKLWVGQESGTHTHTHGQGKLFMPFRHFTAGHNDHLYQIIFKSHHAWQNIVLTWTSFNEAYAQSLRAVCDFDF